MESLAIPEFYGALLDPVAPAAVSRGYKPFAGSSALEDDEFPFETLSRIAELESWRKEINRPVYHMHKWWARRLGTVFRAITLGALSPAGTDLMQAFYSGARLSGAVVFDPFMGSGTTIGEALKLGARGIGRDINPVACFLVRNALSVHDRQRIELEYGRIERDVAGELRNLYKTKMPDGKMADVLYYFWVMMATCPSCGKNVDLFPSRVFARHTNTKDNPLAHALCPECGEVNAINYDEQLTVCTSCNVPYNPQSGPARGQWAICPCCDGKFSISATVRESDAPPQFRMYAKLVLIPDGRKLYQRIAEQDVKLYRKAAKQLERLADGYPSVSIRSGYNTNQVLGYNFRYWHEMFNARQLLCLSILASRIKRIDDAKTRDLFTCLFSGVLEFNNMFASYKGEGTGAVRHMFSHHILKPERMPLEANVWGTKRSSGSFMTLFRGRIQRALDYAADPFEVAPYPSKRGNSGKKVYALSEPLGCDIAESYGEFESGMQLYLSCGDSGTTDLPDRSVDAVITDPPFFDNVHYSQLADFFYVWQRYILDSSEQSEDCTTRSKKEVQNGDEEIFAARLAAVFNESHRVLRDDGQLVFTYHHSRAEGWKSLLYALMEGGFVITAAHPIKSEMSVALPKRQAREPIDHDIILVCRKRSHPARPLGKGSILETAASIAESQAKRLRSHGRRLSRNDIRVIVLAQVLRHLSFLQNRSTATAQLDSFGDDIEIYVNAIHRAVNRLSQKQA